MRACNSVRSDTFGGLCLPDDRHQCREAATVTASAWSHLANKVSQLTEHAIDGGMSSTIMADRYISFVFSSACKQKDRNEKLPQSSRFHKPWLWKSRVIFPINHQFMSSQELSKKISTLIISSKHRLTSTGRYPPVHKHQLTSERQSSTTGHVFTGVYT